MALVLFILLLNLVVRSAALKLPLVPAIYFFGSSYLDVGTNIHLNFTSESYYDPYGETYFHRPTGRNSNGLILSDFLELKLGLPFLPPYLQPGADFSQGVNFASSGSGILDDTNLAKGPVIVSLANQVEQFQHLVSSTKPNHLPDALVVMNVGTNDLLGHITPITDPNLDELVPFLISNLKRFLKVLYHTGARNFLIVGLTTLGNQPSRQGEPGVELLNPTVQVFNAELKKLVMESEQELTGAEMMFSDPYNLFVDIINNGSKYGFEDTRNACYVPREFLCADPSKYLYWNTHPTQEGFRYISDLIWSGGDSWPVNLQSFLNKKLSHETSARKQYQLPKPKCQAAESSTVSFVSANESDEMTENSFGCELIKIC